MITTSRMTRTRILCNVCRYRAAITSIRIRSTEQFVLCAHCTQILQRQLKERIKSIDKGNTPR